MSINLTSISEYCILNNIPLLVTRSKACIGLPSSRIIKKLVAKILRGDKKRSPKLNQESVVCSILLDAELELYSANKKVDLLERKLRGALTTKQKALCTLYIKKSLEATPLLKGDRKSLLQFRAEAKALNLGAYTEEIELLKESNLSLREERIKEAL